jgi:YVTN family beta-propeller protein
VISDATDAVIARITVERGPVGVAFDSHTDEVVVTNSGSGTVSLISDATNKVIGTITVGSDPLGVAFDSHKNEIFVANSGSGTVAAFVG